MEVDVPHSLVGQTLQEASLRQRLGIEVVLIHSARAANDENQGKRFPSPDVRLEAGDRILVMPWCMAPERGVQPQCILGYRSRR